MCSNYEYNFFLIVLKKKKKREKVRGTIFKIILCTQIMATEDDCVNSMLYIILYEIIINGWAIEDITIQTHFIYV